MVKKGDTLIEVAIAIGIFSLISVAVVSVVNSSSSGAQTSLETTLAREEIDAQAEALRFIQAGYIVARNSSASKNGEENNNPYISIWDKITSNAVDSVPSYSPDACIDLYSKGADERSPVVTQHAFVINTNILGKFVSSDPLDPISIDDVYIAAKNDSSTKLIQSSTYPRLVFTKNSETSDKENLSSSEFYEELYSAEGIYIVAVKSTSKIADFSTAYYDFYIRSCWYGTGDKNPSTISTVIRLSDPGLLSI